jgi:hypothetical protein
LVLKLLNHSTSGRRITYKPSSVSKKVVTVATFVTFLPTRQIRNTLDFLRSGDVGPLIISSPLHVRRLTRAGVSGIPEALAGMRQCLRLSARKL